eukprot:CAMPEP_0116106226 /NCGR_PEP_ID=MMETSP0327-20121206/15516_1 /TAXON_ID=44447 /ORGANISM="Pseudo-nitzschia delicatissima, Strain B596" /LENGTH=291 /DNA_ID=CAMNT_0003598811 /DNA_START=94 /DNA_END=969 /DNA_ORIENTATION=+
MAADGYTFYRLFYFFLFAYATYQCMSACIRGSRESANENDEQQRNGEGNGSDNETPVERQRKRRDLVRERLEFRKILAPPEPGKAAELGPPVEPDLEMGEGGNEVPIRRESLNQLTDMGFSINASRKALSNVGGSDTEAAMDWIFDHGNDPDLDDDPVTPEPTLTPYVQREESDTEAAMDWIFDHGNDPDLDDDPVTPEPTLTPYVQREESDTEAAMDWIFDHGNDPDLDDDPVTPEPTLTPYVQREESDTEAAEEEHHDECNHWFHEDCIMEWLQNHDECPLCRTNMVQS